MSTSMGRLVERARVGDADAAEVLVRQCLPQALKLALAILADYGSAEDAVQDAMLSALVHLDECRDTDRFEAWLMAIVRNRARALRRRPHVRRTVPLNEAWGCAAPDDPLDDTERAETRGALRQAMGQLRPVHREALRLFYFEGRSHRQIGTLMGITEGSSRVRLHAARRSLRSKLGRSAVGPRAQPISPRAIATRGDPT